MALEQTSLYCLSGFLQQGDHSDLSGCGSGCKLMRMKCDCLGKEDPGTEKGANQLASGERQLRKLAFMESFVEHQAGVTSLNPTFTTQRTGKLNENISSLTTDELQK